MVFLQMLLRDGTFNGAQILRPETVGAMRTNQIGDLDVNPLKSSAPAWSNDANLFPGMQQKWGLSFDINTRPGPNGRSAGSYSWAGLLNCYYWVDPSRRSRAPCSLSCFRSTTRASWICTAHLSGACTTGLPESEPRSEHL